MDYIGPFLFEKILSTKFIHERKNVQRFAKHLINAKGFLRHYIYLICWSNLLEFVGF